MTRHTSKLHYCQRNPPAIWTLPDHFCDATSCQLRGRCRVRPQEIRRSDKLCVKTRTFQKKLTFLADWWLTAEDFMMKFKTGETGSWVLNPVRPDVHLLNNQGPVCSGLGPFGRFTQSFFRIVEVKRALFVFSDQRNNPTTRTRRVFSLEHRGTGLSFCVSVSAFTSVCRKRVILSNVKAMEAHLSQSGSGS